MSKFNEPLDLREGKPRVVFVNQVKWLAGIVAVDDRVRQNACTRTIGRPDTLPGTCSISSHCVQSSWEGVSLRAMTGAPFSGYRNAASCGVPLGADEPASRNLPLLQLGCVHYCEIVGTPRLT